MGILPWAAAAQGARSTESTAHEGKRRSMNSVHGATILPGKEFPPIRSAFSAVSVAKAHKEG